MPVKMARGEITQRRGVVLKVEGAGKTAFSELLPLEHFGTESLDSSLEFLETVSEITFDDFRRIPENLPATRFAIESALLELLNEEGAECYFRSNMPVSKLLPANERLDETLEGGLRDGFTIFKLKIGLKGFAEDLAMIRSVAAKLPDGAMIRLDANEGLGVEQAKRWLDQLESLPVEFLEQPLRRDMVDETIVLSQQFPTELALDESIATTRDIIDCCERGFRGVFAVKPMRLAELSTFLDWRTKSKAKISYSTVFETKIGSMLGLKLAASDSRNNFGLGYGVSHWMKEAELVLPSQSSYSLDDILSIDRRSVWENLS